MMWPGLCEGIQLLDHPAWREPARPAAAKPLAQPLAVSPVRGGLDLLLRDMSNSRVGTRLDVCERPLLEAAAPCVPGRHSSVGRATVS